MTSLYDQDIVLWAEQQGRLLRDAGQHRRNEPIDWENVAEEIESLGQSQSAEASRRLMRIVEHMLKLRFSPAQEPRRGWLETVYQQRADLALVLDASPSLRTRLSAMLQTAARRGAGLAANSLAAYGEVEASQAVVRHGGRYSLAEVLDGDPLAPERPLA